MGLLDSLVRMLGKPFGVARYRTRGRHVDSVIAPMRDFLSQAEKSVKIATGEMYHGVYEHPEIVAAFEKLTRKGVGIEIIRSPEIDSGTVSIPRMAEEGKLKMYRLREEPTHHFWLIDDRHVLDEDPHTLEQKEREFYLIKDGGFLAETLLREFNERKNDAQSS